MHPVYILYRQRCSRSSHRGVHSVMCRLLCSHLRPGHRGPPQRQHHGPQHRTGWTDDLFYLCKLFSLHLFFSWCSPIVLPCLSALPHRLWPHPGQLQVQVWHQEGACTIYPHTRLHPRHTAGQDGIHRKVWQVCSTFYPFIFSLCLSLSIQYVSFWNLLFGKKSELKLL